MKIIDLFCGAGGMSEGFRQAGFDVVFACDHSKEASETYINRQKQLGYEHPFYNGDINYLAKGNNIFKYVKDNITIVTGGPPCQGFSLTGKRDKNDPRNYLFLPFLRIVKKIQPQYFVIENVEGLLSFKLDEVIGIHGRKYKNITPAEVIMAEAERFGFNLKYQVLNTKNYGVPQSRNRVIFIGYKRSLPEPNFPEPLEKIISVKDALSDLSYLQSGHTSHRYNASAKSNYQKESRSGRTLAKTGTPIENVRLENHEASKHTELVRERFAKLNPGESIKDLLSRLSEAELKKLETKKRQCRRLNGDSISPTVLTLPDDIVHYELPRILTVRELARLQSFDDSFHFLGVRTTGGDRRKETTPQYTQVGNAVPPLFARAIALEIKKAINR